MGKKDEVRTKVRYCFLVGARPRRQVIFLNRDEGKLWGEHSRKENWDGHRRDCPGNCVKVKSHGMPHTRVKPFKRGKGMSNLISPAC